MDSLAAIKYAKVKPVRGDIKDKDGNIVASNVVLISKLKENTLNLVTMTAVLMS